MNSAIKAVQTVLNVLINQCDSRQTMGVEGAKHHNLRLRNQVLTARTYVNFCFG